MLICAVVLVCLAALAGFIGFTMPSAMALMLCLVLTLAAGIALDARVVARWRASRHQETPFAS